MRRAVCCSVLQCVAVCCGVLRCVALFLVYLRHSECMKDCFTSIQGSFECMQSFFECMLECLEGA